ESKSAMTERCASKPRGTPNFLAEPPKRLDKKIGSPTREPLRRVLTRTAPSWPPASSFTSNQGDDDDDERPRNPHRRAAPRGQPLRSGRARPDRSGAGTCPRGAGGDHRRRRCRAGRRASPLREAIAVNDGTDAPGRPASRP